MKKELIIFISKPTCPACVAFTNEVELNETEQKWIDQGFEFEILKTTDKDHCDKYQKEYKIKSPNFVPALYYVVQKNDGSYYNHKIENRDHIINVDVDEIRKHPPIVIDLSKKYMKYKSKYLLMKK